MNGSVHEHILNTDKPDRHIEYFWMTFKDSIRGFLTEEEKKEIDKLSTKLNTLQDSCQYYQIEKYIKTHIEGVGWKIISSDQSHSAHLLDTNLKRWTRLTGTELFTTRDPMFAFLRLYISIQDPYKLKEYRKKIHNLVVKYHSLNEIEKKETLRKIAVMAIKNDACGVLDKLRYLFDFSVFFPKGTKLKFQDMTGKTIMKHVKKYGAYDPFLHDMEPK